METLNYFEAADPAKLRQEYPLGDKFLRRFQGMSLDELRDLQNARFRRVMEFAWKTPFYRRLWGEVGIQPGDVRDLDDISKLPTYSKVDLMRAVERQPPLGDFHGMEAYGEGPRPQIIIQTTSGTTGKPQPLLFGPRSREIQNILLARAFVFQGMCATDVVHSMYGFGMVNGGHYIREAISHWVGAQVLSAGTGVETRSVQQVQLMRDFGASALVGFADYAKRLAEVARATGIIPGSDINLRMISGHVGADASALSEMWGGCEVFDWYGVGDTGTIAAEGKDHAGLYVFEDAQFIEVVDPETYKNVQQSEVGDLVCTCLYKDDVFPIIRFNTHDVTKEVTGATKANLPFRRIAGFLGRSDNMVKLRGINVYPTAIGSLLDAERKEFAGDYICKVARVMGRDEMTVVVEINGERPENLKEDYEDWFRARLGVDISVDFEAPGGLAELTGIESRQKPVRLIDERKV